MGQERVTNPKERLRGRLKTLGIYLDEHLNWKTQIAPVQGKLTKNLGILYQLRNYLNLKMLRQLYYALINPYLNYGAMCWGNTYQTNLNKICTKQNKCIRVFFCKQTRAISPILPNPWNFKMFLLIHNQYSLAFKLYSNPSTVPAVLHNFLTPTTTVHSYNSRNYAKYNFYRPKVSTNISKFNFKYSASVMWESDETVPLSLKQAKTFNKFKKLNKAHLISCHSNNIGPV